MTVRKMSYCQSCVKSWADGEIVDTLKATLIHNRVYWLCERCRVPFDAKMYKRTVEGQRRSIIKRKYVSRV